MKTDKQLLNDNPELYRVARQGGTERPGSSEFLHLSEEGVFHCAVCGAALFKTDEKFESGTGWPSFTDPVHEGAVKRVLDKSHGMVRTEVRCSTCDAHLGHVFPDGPRKADGTRADRYCINGVCLGFQKETI